MNLLSLVLVAVSIFSSLAFGQFVPSRSGIKAINVFSGAPQPIDGPSKYAGFGDIAANLVSSVELKRRYPDLKIRLIVTSAEKRYDPLIPTTNEIIKIMAPVLEPEKKGAPQMYEGVEVVFVDYDFGPLLDETKFAKLPGAVSKQLRLWHLKWATWQLQNKLPAADLNLNFSHFPESAPILRVSAPLALGIEEHYGSRNMLGYNIAPGKFGGGGGFIELASGPTSTGFMLARNRPSKSEAFALIRQWADKAGVNLPPEEFSPVFSYTAGKQSAQVYIHALEALDLSGHVVLFIKDHEGVDMSHLPANVQIVKLKGLPHEVMSALIQESVISPLVTGDISLGQALSSVNVNKTLVYEAPEWKVESASGMRKAIADDLGIKPHDLRNIFLTTESLMKMSAEQLKQKGLELAKILGDKPFQARLYQSIRSRQSRWDILENTLQIGQSALQALKTKADWNSAKEAAQATANRLLQSKNSSACEGLFADAG